MTTGRCRGREGGPGTGRGLCSGGQRDDGGQRLGPAVRPGCGEGLGHVGPPGPGRCGRGGGPGPSGPGRGRLVRRDGSGRPGSRDRSRWLVRRKGFERLGRRGGPEWPVLRDGSGRLGSRGQRAGGGRWAGLGAGFGSGWLGEGEPVSHETMPDDGSGSGGAWRGVDYGWGEGWLPIRPGSEGDGRDRGGLPSGAGPERFGDEVQGGLGFGLGSAQEPGASKLTRAADGELTVGRHARVVEELQDLYPGRRGQSGRGQQGEHPGRRDGAREVRTADRARSGVLQHAIAHRRGDDAGPAAKRRGPAWAGAALPDQDLGAQSPLQVPTALV
jgi:hypothetical protein